MAQEYKIIELIVAQADEAVITLSTDNENIDDSSSLFGYVNKSAGIIEKIADKVNVKTEKIILSQNHRAKSKELAFAEKNIFSPGSSEYNFECNDIEIYSAKNISDECENVSRRIKQLLRNGYRACEITVITRDAAKYRDELSAAFKKYGVPYYNDERQPINTQPLVVTIKYLLRCVINSFNSDDVISLAKTGMTSLTDDKINELENYAYLWNINGGKWLSDFTDSPHGFEKEITSSDKERLASINETRDALISPIVKFKKRAKSKNAEEICRSIYDTLIAFGADIQLKEYAVSLSNRGFHALAGEQGRVWELVMDILNQIAVTVTDPIALKEFNHLFSLIISTEDVGTLPSGIDNVQFGQANRIRTDNPKAVFVLGANEDEFPLNASGSGLLTENERRIMLDNDFKLYSYGEILDLQERYFAYSACTCAREKLFVSYFGAAGKNASPSEIVTELTSAFPLLKEYTYNDISDMDLIESRENAFELMSERYFYNTPFYSSLKKYFEGDPSFSAVKALAENRDKSIENKEISSELFGRDMYISASRVENFYSCPFRYFCKFGLGARPRVKAEIDPMRRGTIIHYVLEMILSTVGSKALSQMNEEDIKSLVDKYTLEYFENDMGNISDASKRFKYNYNRLSKLMYSVVIHLSHEFADSDFEAKAFEMSIDKDGEVKPSTVLLDDGGSVRIRGSIDRVDTFEKDGERYVRVVDYKSGSKTFSLSDVMHGLNLQMFIYLFSLCDDKTASLNGIPAGVLYMHSAREMFTFDSKSQAQSKISGEEDKSYKMKGIVLNDEDGIVPEAMEHDLKGKYIPVRLKADGELTGNLISANELELIHKKTDSLIKKMGEELHSGHISQSPVEDSRHKNTCEYCDYSDICAVKKSIEPNTFEDISDSEIKNLLQKEFDENAEMD
ncbi:MAG: PD-(D/E)XK nuclease family protein [Clostridiales bacterium]|nr:PD-(D/E)XK nuclease family protein [Clostridiales bacterium]